MAQDLPWGCSRKAGQDWAWLRLVDPPPKVSLIWLSLSFLPSRLLHRAIQDKQLLFSWAGDLRVQGRSHDLGLSWPSLESGMPWLQPYWSCRNASWGGSKEPQFFMFQCRKNSTRGRVIDKKWLIRIGHLWALQAGGQGSATPRPYRTTVL